MSNGYQRFREEPTTRIFTCCDCGERIEAADILDVKHTCKLGPDSATNNSQDPKRTLNGIGTILSFDRPCNRERMVQEARDFLLECGYPVSNDFRRTPEHPQYLEFLSDYLGEGS